MKWLRLLPAALALLAALPAFPETLTVTPATLDKTNGKWVIKKTVMRVCKNTFSYEADYAGGGIAERMIGWTLGGRCAPNELPINSRFGTSWADNLSFNFVHATALYRTTQPQGMTPLAAAALPVGAPQTAAPPTPLSVLPTLDLACFQRTRDLTETGSLGVGAFFNIDVNLSLFSVPEGGNVIILFDPQALNKHRFIDGPYSHPFHPSDPLDGVFVSFKTNAHKEIRLYNAQGQLTTTLPTAARADLVNWSGTLFRFQIVSINGALVGRLTRIQDRNGYALDITYKHQPGGDLGGSEPKLWQIDRVRDAHNQEAVFSYGASQVGGRWAVSQIDLPSGALTFDYTDGYLSAIHFPDDSTSTFTRTYDADTQCTVVRYDDPAAMGDPIVSEAYLTNNFSTMNDLPDDVAPTAAALVRMVTDGSGAVSYLNFPHPDYTLAYVFESGGALREVYCGWQSQKAQNWTLTINTTQQLNYDASLSASWVSPYDYANIPDWNSYQRWYRWEPDYVNSAAGLHRTFQYNEAGNAVVIGYPDGTTEKFKYNGFQQVSIYKDQQGNVTKTTYDSQGNMLTFTTGLALQNNDMNLEPVPAPGQTPATWTWTYYPEGSAQQFLLATATDPGGDTIYYTYDENHQPIPPNSPPSVTITSPENGAFFVYPITVIIKATASDSDGSIRKVEFYQGSAKIGEDTTEPYELSWTVLEEGEYPTGDIYLTAVAHDNDDASTTSTAVRIHSHRMPIDYGVYITSPSDRDILTDPKNVVISARVERSNVVRVDFYRGTTKLGEDTTTPYECSWDNVLPGTYTLTAKAYDETGNYDTSPEAVVTVTAAPETVWVDDALPAGASPGADGGDSWIWVPSNPKPFSGFISHQSNVSTGLHQHGFTGATETLRVATGDILFAYIYLNPLNIPSEVMLQWYDGSWEHRAYWGANNINMGTDGTASRRYMGPLPSVGTLPWSGIWVRLEVPASQVGLEERTLTGMSFTLFDGQATWDHAGKVPGPSNRPPIATADAYSVAENTTLWIPAPGVLANDSDPDAGNVITAVKVTDPNHGLVTLNADGSFTYIPESNWNGSDHFTYRARDTQGMESVEATVTITVTPFNDPPYVTISSPANNAMFNAPATIAILADAGDPDGTIAKVEFFQGATKLGESASFPYQYNWSSVSSGSYTLTAKATDNAGASTTSATVSITVNAANQPPSVAIRYPSTGAIFAAPASIAIQATAGDPDGTIAKVEFYQGSTKLGESTAPPYQVAWTNVAAGSYLLTAKTYDNLGASSTSGEVSVTVMEPDQLPSVTITSPANGATFNPTASITIQASASDPDTNDIAKVEFYQGSTKLGEATTSPYQYTWTNVARGRYSLTAMVYDKRGVMTPSPSVEIVVSAAPMVTITSPANADTFTAPASITIQANATDGVGRIANVEFFQGATKVGEATTEPYMCTWMGVSSGSYSLTAKATNDVGASATSATVSIDVQMTPPVAITSPASGATFKPNANIPIAATAPDPGGNVTVSRVDFYKGSTLLGQDTSRPYEITWNAVPAGQYTLTAKAYYSSGPSKTSAPVLVAVTPNRPPIANADHYGTAKNATLTVAAPGVLANDLDLHHDSLTAVKVTDPSHGSLALNPDGSFTYTPAANYYGSDSFTYKARDNDNADSAAVTVTITVNAPPVAEAGPNQTVMARDGDGAETVTLDGSGSHDPDGTIVSYVWMEGTQRIATGAAPRVRLDAGDHAITLIVTDDAGLTASDAVWVTVLWPGIRLEWWTGIPGQNVSDLTGNPKFLSPPTGKKDVRDLFEAPADWADNYGSRMRGYFTPPATGTYTFYIASSHQSELWLSTNAAESAKVKIAWVGGWTAPREWSKSAEPNQKSSPVFLSAGARYYMEALHKAGTGADHLAVGMDPPGGAAERPILASRFEPYATQTMTLLPGYNHVGLAVAPPTPLTAESFAQGINAQGGSCTQVTRYDKDMGSYVTHSVGAAGNNFSVVVGEGYMLNCSAASAARLSGRALCAPRGRIALAAGYSLIALPVETNRYVAETAATEINGQGGSAIEVQRYDTALQSYVKHTVGSASNNFPLKMGEAYFIRCTNGSTWTLLYDPVSPDTRFTQTPSNPTNATTATFAFEASKPGCGFQRTLDGGNVVSVTSPESLPGLAAGFHVYEVRAIDGDGNLDLMPASYTWLVTGAPVLEITTVTLPPGIPDWPYAQALSAANGVPPYQWSLVAGALPDGLALNTGTGVISGTPTQAGAGLKAFTVEVTDSRLPTAGKCRRAFGLFVAAPLSIAGTQAGRGVAGEPYRFQLSAVGGNPPYWWSPSGALPDGLTLDASGSICGKPAVWTTPEMYRDYQFDVCVKDGTGKSALDRISLRVAAPLAITPPSFPLGFETQPYAPASIEITGGNDPVECEVVEGILPPGLKLQRDTVAFPPPDPPKYYWSIQGIPALGSSGYNHADYTFTIEARDATSTPIPIRRQITCNLSIGDRLKIVTQSLPSGFVMIDNPYSDYKETLSATGGLSPYSWSLSANSNSKLPPGLSLDSASGVISGKPTLAGVYQFVVFVTDSASPARASVARTLEINIVDSDIDIYPTMETQGIIGRGFNSHLEVTHNAKPNLYWSTNPAKLPAGLKLELDSTAQYTNEIAGIPYEQYTKSLTINAVDGIGRTAKRTVTYDIQPPLIIKTAATMEIGAEIYPLPICVPNKLFNQRLIATDALYPVSWKLIGGNLPNGLVLDAVGGFISGTPVASEGKYDFEVNAVDSSLPSSQTATRKFRIVVRADSNDALFIATSYLTEGELGQDYTQDLVVYGRDWPYTWIVQSGSLPPGIVLSSEYGYLSGTPTQAGSWNVTMKVTNQTGQSDVQSYVMTIKSTPVKSTPALAPGIVGLYYRSVVESAGGFAPIHWSVYSYAFGLYPNTPAVNADRNIELSGIPTENGVFDVSCFARDDPNLCQNVSRTLSVTIAEPVRIVTADLPIASVGVPYQAPLEAAGGNGNLSWRAIGNWPEGLFVSGASIIGTPAAAGQYLVTVRAQDETIPDAGGPSIDTRTLHLTVIGNPPSPPSGVTALPGDGQVTIGFVKNPPAERVDFYEILRGIQTGGPYQKVGEVSNSILSVSPRFTDTPLTNTVRYYYVLRAVDVDGNASAGSREVTATPKSGAGSPPNPPVITISSCRVRTTTPTIRGMGTPNNTIYVFLLDNLDTSIGTGPVDQNGRWNIPVSALQPNAEYAFVAQEAAGNLVSILSNAVRITIDTTPPASVSGLAVIPGDAYVDLFWSPSQETDLLGYEVWRKASNESTYTKVSNKVENGAGANQSVIIETRFRDRTATNNGTYSYKVIAVDNALPDTPGP